MKKPYSKKRLFLACGPVEIHPSVQKSFLYPVIHHRSKEFQKLFASVSTKLKKVFFTKNPVLTIHGVGTAAMEAAFVNLTKPSDEILILENGIFSHRWIEIAKTFGSKISVLKFPYGYALDLNLLEKKLVRYGRRYKAVFLNHVETSTATLNDVYTISKLVKKYSNAFVIVDAMASVGAEKLYSDKWGLDAVITSSCKAFANAAGLSFVALSAKALKHIESNKVKTYYFDFAKIYEYYKKNQTPFTGSSVLFYGQDKALDIMLGKGMEKIWQQTKNQSDYMKNLCDRFGLEIFSKNPANSLIAIKTNKADFIVKQMQKRFNIVISSGQGGLKGKLIRISNMTSITKKLIYETFLSVKKIMGGI